jgi:hypothetical protein
VQNIGELQNVRCAEYRRGAEYMGDAECERYRI